MDSVDERGRVSCDNWVVLIIAMYLNDNWHMRQLNEDGVAQLNALYARDIITRRMTTFIFVRHATNDWVKKTCVQRETLTIAGFALDGTKWDGLYVGRRKGDEPGR